MKRSVKTSLLGVLLLALAGCGEVRNPLEKPKPFVATPVPTDFAIVVDETADTYYARQDIRQVVTAADLMSRTTYTTRRDYNNAVANQFTSDHPVSQEQLQSMWNEVSKYDLLQGGRVWYYWESFPDSYRRTERVMQIRANGKAVTYKQLNHWGYKLRDLALQVESVRFGGATAPVVSATAPANATSSTRLEAVASPTTQPVAPETPSLLTPVTTPAAETAASEPATQP